MKKHNTILHAIIWAIPAFFLLFVSASYAVENKQQILLDSSGKPLSKEILLLLSSSARSLRGIEYQASKIEIKRKKEGINKNFNKSNPKNTSNPFLEKELLYYLKLGQIPKVKKLLAKGVKPVYKNNNGETPLGIAVTRGWASMVITLIKHGADIHEKGVKGLTLLHIASAHGLTDVAKVLVRNGLFPGERTDKDWTPLHIAARYGHWELVQYYIEKGVNPNIRNSDGQTALGLARHLNHKGIVKILSRVTRVRSLPFKVKNRRKRHQRQSRSNKITHIEQLAKKWGLYNSNTK